MPEGVSSNTFTLEQEISQLEQTLAAKRKVLEREQPPRETLYELIGEKLGSVPPAAPPARPADNQPSISQPPPLAEPPAYLSGPLKDQVQQLVNAAFTQSIAAAIKQARAIGNAALIDAFHDALVDELYQQLVERGKLEPLK